MSTTYYCGLIALNLAYLYLVTKWAEGRVNHWLSRFMLCERELERARTEADEARTWKELYREDRDNHIRRHQAIVEHLRRIKAARNAPTKETA